MTLMEKYVDAINKRDAELMASIFAEDCYFNDGGGRLDGNPDLVANSREDVRKTFTAIFQRVKPRAEIKRLNEHSMEYDIISRGEVKPCVGLLTEKDGLISEYIVRPK